MRVRERERKRERERERESLIHYYKKIMTRYLLSSVSFHKSEQLIEILRI